MSERFLDWLATKASAYLVWMYERERRGKPTCPDCNLTEGVDCECQPRDYPIPF